MVRLFTAAAVALLSLITFLASPPSCTSQQGPTQTPTFRTETQLVEVDTVATDSHGKAVTDLRADEFKVFEDDHHRELAHFSFERVEKLDLHATERVRALAQHKSKLVYSNFAEDVSAVPLNGCTLLLADWLNTPLELQPQAQEQLKEFIRTADLAKPLAIYALDRSLHLIQDFTTDRTVLLSSIEKSGIHTVNLQPEKRASRSLDATRTDWRVQRTALALTALALHVRGLRGRKNLIWLSGSFPAGMFPTDLTGLTPAMEGFYGGYIYGEPRDFTGILEQVSHVLADSGIAVYPVDAQGLESRMTDASQESVRLYQNALTQRTAQRQQSMRNVADLTGGQAFYNHNDISRELQDAYTDGDSFYALAFNPSLSRPDGKIHKIRLVCTRPGIQLRYRKSYFAEVRSSSDAISRSQLETFVRETGQTANGLLLMGELDPNDPGRLKVWIDGSTLMPMQSEHPAFRMDVAVATFDAHGSVLSQSYANLRIKLKPANIAQIQGSGMTQTVQFLRTRDVARVRLAMRDLATGRVGTLEVPVISVSDSR
jgi:VWFA-related protein